MRPMRRLRLPLAAAAASVVVAGCGGGGDASHSGPTTGTGSTAPPGEATLPAEPTTTVDAAPTFPAETASGVLALAGLRPAASVRYAVTTPDGTSTLDLARDEARGRLHRITAEDEVWVGVDVGGGAVRFVCEASPGGTPTCRDGDPEGRGAQAVAEVASLVGNDALRRTFSPAAALSGTGVGVDTQAGLQVSCLAVTTEGRDLRLCASAEGIITEVTAGTTTAKATNASADVLDADLEPPAPPG